MTLPVLLTQDEAAAHAGCNARSIANMRYRGLAYIPGRPALIDKADLDAYIAAKKAAAEARLPKPAADEDPVARASALAERTWRLRRGILKRR